MPNVRVTGSFKQRFAHVIVLSGIKLLKRKTWHAKYANIHTGMDTTNTINGVENKYLQDIMRGINSREAIIVCRITKTGILNFIILTA